MDKSEHAAYGGDNVDGMVCGELRFLMWCETAARLNTALEVQGVLTVQRMLHAARKLELVIDRKRRGALMRYRTRAHPNDTHWNNALGRYIGPDAWAVIGDWADEPGAAMVALLRLGVTLYRANRGALLARRSLMYNKGEDA